MREHIQLVTSLAPQHIENQRRAMDSWMRAGFSVTSLNTEPEIGQVRSSFPELDFQSVTRDASSECGRPLVYLNDVFAFLKTTGPGVCGIVNSDIHLRANASTVNYVLEQARGSLVLICRTDVDTLESRTGEIFKHGIDVFLFDTAVLERLPPSRFCLGQPWWDYWFPSCVLVMQKDIAIKLVTFPFVAHIRHTSNWDRDRNFEKYGLHCLQYFDPARREALLKQSAEQLRLSIGQYSMQLAQAIWRQSRWLSYAARAC